MAWMIQRLAAVKLEGVDVMGTKNVSKLRKVMSFVIAGVVLLSEMGAKSVSAGEGSGVTDNIDEVKISAAGDVGYSEIDTSVEGGYLAVYPVRYEPNMGVEFAQYPSKEYTDTYRTDVLYAAISKDGVNYEALNYDKAIYNPVGYFQMGSPSIFRKADGTFGLIASENNSTDRILLVDSWELIFYENQRTVKLNEKGITVSDPYVVYDDLSKEYKIYWTGGDGDSYLTTTEDFTSFSEPVKTDYTKEKVTGKLPEYALSDEASVFKLTQKEYERVYKKYSRMHSVSVDVKNINIKSGEKITLPEKLDVIYSDDSRTPMKVTWDTSGVNMSNPSDGEYVINGELNADTGFNSPLALYRADPFMTYDEENGVYYFTGSNMNEKSASGGGAYENIILRRADSINEITEADEVVVWKDGTTEDGVKVTGWYWAPELHKIGGKWRIIAQASVTENGNSLGSKQCIFTCNGNDLMDPDNWEYTGYIHNTTNNQSVGAFDTTYFEYGGQSYYVTPRNSKIWITTVDPKDPCNPTGPLVQLSGADRAYEANNGSGKAGYNDMSDGRKGQCIQEASSVLIHDDKIFIAYAGCTIDMMYCVCLLYADLDSDFTDPDSWSKYPYPILNTQQLTTTIKTADYTKTDGTTDVTGNGNNGLLDGAEGEYKGTFGPGHNSFTVDTNGNPVIIYHARDWDDEYPGATGDAKYGLVDPGRHAYAANVVFDYDGFPVVILDPEDYLAADLKKVSVKVRVGETPVEQNNAGQNSNSNASFVNSGNNNLTSTNNGTSNGAVKSSTTNDAGNQTTGSSKLKKGQKITYKNIIYKVLSVGNKGNGKVAATGVKKKNITSLNIPKTITVKGKKFKVTKIEKKAFAGLKKLKTAVIGANVTKVEKSAFSNCKKLTKLVFKSKKLKKLSY